jgi:hypothetical protein
MCKQKITQKFLSTPKNTQITELKNQFKKTSKTDNQQKFFSQKQTYDKRGD